MIFDALEDHQVLLYSMHTIIHTKLLTTVVKWYSLRTEYRLVGIIDDIKFDELVKNYTWCILNDLLLYSLYWINY